MDLPGVLRAVRSRWIVIIGLSLLGLLLAVGATSQLAAKYSSKVTFFVSTPVSQTQSAYQGSQFGTDRVNSYVQLLSSDALADRIVKAQGSTEDPHLVARRISGTADLNSVLLTATATGPSPAQAESLASGIASQFNTLVQDLDVTPSSKTPTVELSVVSGPTDAVQTAPNKKLNYLLGLVVGFVCGLAWAILRELSDTTVKSADQFSRVTGRALLGTLSLAPRGTSPVLDDTDNYSPLLEESRQIRTNLQFVHVDEPPRVVAVTSAIGGDGKSTTSINLARVFAESGRTAVLIDADLRRGTVASTLEIDGTLGLSDLLASRVGLDDVLHESTHGLTVLPGGTVPPNPVELLDSRHMRDLLVTLRSRFDVVVIDTPPVLPVTDGVILARQADGVILVARQGGTRRAQARQAAEALGAVNAKILGLILTHVPRARRDRSVYSYYQDSSTPAPSKPVRSGRKRRPPSKSSKRAMSGSGDHLSSGQTDQSKPSRPKITPGA